MSFDTHTSVKSEGHIIVYFVILSKSVFDVEFQADIQEETARPFESIQL